MPVTSAWKQPVGKRDDELLVSERMVRTRIATGVTWCRRRTLPQLREEFLHIPHPSRIVAMPRGSLNSFHLEIGLSPQQAHTRGRASLHPDLVGPILLVRSPVFDIGYRPAAHQRNRDTFNCR